MSDDEPEDYYSDWRCGECGTWHSCVVQVCTCKLEEDAASESADAERSAIVRWLREHNAPPVLIDGIVHGEHR